MTKKNLLQELDQFLENLNNLTKQFLMGLIFSINIFVPESYKIEHKLATQGIYYCSLIAIIIIQGYIDRTNKKERDDDQQLKKNKSIINKEFKSNGQKL